MVSLEPVELLDHHRAGRKRVRVLVWASARQENLSKARIRRRRLAQSLAAATMKSWITFPAHTTRSTTTPQRSALPRRKPPVSGSSVGLATSATPMTREELKFLLNHAVSSGGVTMGYLHPSLEHLRGWQERATARILAAIGLARVFKSRAGDLTSAAAVCDVSASHHRRWTRIAK
jgi:hypothetical protein